ncbi:MAG: glycosyltransferase [Candidatus Eisenbacteria bacterium]|nr:glycosyltransferase [Candidatus Eisenbacteria bacterium]
MKASVVLPTYNEASNIVNLIRSIIGNLPADWEHEIIVVDDNSPDGTCQAVKEAFGENPAVSTILRTEDRGLAKSIRAGIERATGDQILVMDTDFTHDPLEIPKMLHVSKVYDIVSGSRFCPGGKMGSYRHYLCSLVYNWFVRWTLRTQIQDNLGGFFTMSRQCLLSLPFDRIFFGYGDYYFRLLHYAQRRGMSIIETPSFYHTRQKGNSKSQFWKLFFNYTAALFRLKAAARREEGQREAGWQHLVKSKRS